MSHVESLQLDHLGQRSQLVHFVVRDPELLQSVPDNLQTFRNIQLNVFRNQIETNQLNFLLGSFLAIIF